MKTDNELRRDVERQLEWEPSVDERRIGVSAIDGIVTLTGEVGSPQSAVHALKWNVMVPSHHVTVKVENGWITFRGEVKWDYERPGCGKIEETFRREATYDANRISVQVSGGTVTPCGSVRSWAERHAAERAALAAPGVSEVVNYVTVDSATAAA